MHDHVREMLMEQMKILRSYLAESEDLDVQFLRTHGACIAQLCEILLGGPKTGGLGHMMDVERLRVKPDLAA